MHYYKFNIGDFDKITRHLNITERGLYRDLLDLYIKNEKPIITDMQKLERLLCVKSKFEKTALQNVLSDFFVLTDDGYFCEYCQSILDDTTEKADTARENGKKGGRPPKQSQSHDLPSGNQKESENKPNENPKETQEKPKNNPNENYPLPNTHNPLPNINNTHSNAHEPKTADEVLAKAEQVKQANAQNIQNWVAPSLGEMDKILKLAGYAGVLTQKDYDRHVSDMKIHYEAQAPEGKNLATDSLRKNKLRDWIMRDEQKKSKPSYQKKATNNQDRFGTANDPLAVNHVWGQDVTPVATQTYEEAMAEMKARIETKGYEELL